MTPLGYATLLSLPAVVFLLFAIFPARKAVIYSFLWGWFFLPVYEIRVHGLVEFSKLSATPLSVLAATCIFDLERILSFRPKIWDLPGRSSCSARSFPPCTISSAPTTAPMPY